MSDISVQCDEYEWMTFTYKGALYRWNKKPKQLLRYFRLNNVWQEVSMRSEAGHALTIHLAINEVAKM